MLIPTGGVTKHLSGPWPDADPAHGLVLTPTGGVTEHFSGPWPDADPAHGLVLTPTGGVTEHLSVPWPDADPARPSVNTNRWSHRALVRTLTLTLMQLMAYCWYWQAKSTLYLLGPQHWPMSQEPSCYPVCRFVHLVFSWSGPWRWPYPSGQGPVLMHLVIMQRTYQLHSLSNTT